MLLISFKNTYIHAYVHTFVHTYIHTHSHIHTYINIHTHTCIHTYIHTHIHTYTHTHTHTHTYMHTHTYTHSHKHTHTHLPNIHSHLRYICTLSHNTHHSNAMLYVPCGRADISFVYSQISFSTPVYFFTTQAFDASISIMVRVFSTTSRYHSFMWCRFGAYCLCSVLQILLYRAALCHCTQTCSHFSTI